MPSTLLWQKAIEDLQVNAPFQRLRKSLLLLLQLLVLIAAALALGKPMFQHVRTHDDNVIILIDQSASMSVVEPDGRTRLDAAREQARHTIDNMSDDGRAMVIAFCDRAYVASPFDTNKSALKARIDAIEQTDGASRLGEAIALAEAYLQNIIIGKEEGGADVAPESAAPPASVYLFTDGNIEDLDKVSPQRLNVDNLRVYNLALRSDNVGILAMDARRHYERPEALQVFATVRNFGAEPVTCDATLYLDDQVADVQTIRLEGAPPEPEGGDPTPLHQRAPAAGTVAAVAFDEVNFESAGAVEVRLMIDDALLADNRAWTLVEPPRDVSVLLVTDGSIFLENALATLPIVLETITPAEYESRGDEELIDNGRCRYDVVVFDGHSTSRLPQGNYFFWGAAPNVEGVALGRTIDDEIIFNWDETHPILRHVAVETVQVFEWRELKLPREAVSLIDGQTSPVLSLLNRDASQYLICAFRLISEDDAGNPIMNTFWVTKVHFIVFLQNAVQYLASAISTAGVRTVPPGEPVTLPAPAGAATVLIRRPDAVPDSVPVGDFPTIHYARTRKVGVYRAEPGVPGEDRFAVNLFSEIESHVAPQRSMTIGQSPKTAQATSMEVNDPAWPWFLLGLLAFLLIEWVVYNRRVLV
ncbi:MAG: VWA domain-containing protein [Phycisphaerales bacterium]|nr:MAG: VWA domain-containing protein [Phycisphaerales bacterium]